MENNANNAMRSNLVKSFISDLTPYLGEYDDLSRFLSDVEDIIPPLTELDPLETLIRFKQITQKLRGKARRILQEKPITWDQVRTLLIRECADRLDIGSQIVAMERVTYMGTIYKTYEKLLYWQTRMLDKIELGTDPAEEKTILINSVRRRCYLQLRKSLPQACQGALTSRNCQSLTEAIAILHDEDFLTYDRYHEDRRVNYSRPTNQIQRSANQNNPPQRQVRNYDAPVPQNPQQRFRNPEGQMNHNQRFRHPEGQQNPNSRFRNPEQNRYPRNYDGARQPRQYEQRPVNRDNNSGQTRNRRPWRFNPENFEAPVQYNATGDTEPMEVENFYLTPHQPTQPVQE